MMKDLVVGVAAILACVLLLAAMWGMTDRINKLEGEVRRCRDILELNDRHSQ